MIFLEKISRANFESFIENTVAHKAYNLLLLLYVNCASQVTKVVIYSTYIYLYFISGEIETLKLFLWKKLHFHLKITEILYCISAIRPQMHRDYHQTLALYKLFTYLFTFNDYRRQLTDGWKTADGRETSAEQGANATEAPIDDGYSDVNDKQPLLRRWTMTNRTTSDMTQPGWLHGPELVKFRRSRGRNFRRLFTDWRSTAF